MASSFKDELKNDRQGISGEENHNSNNELINRVKGNFNSVFNVEELKKKKGTSTNNEELEAYPFSLAHQFIDVKEIYDFMIITKDNRALTILEINPVNFELRSIHEQIMIVESFQNYLLLAPISFQIKCISKPPTVAEMLGELQKDLDEEKIEGVKEMHANNIEFITNSILDEGISNRYFIILEHDNRFTDSNKDKLLRDLEDARYSARQYLNECGLSILNYNKISRHETANLLYEIINNEEKVDENFKLRLSYITQYYKEHNNIESIDEVPLTEFLSPYVVEFEDKNYVKVNDTYMSFIFISGNGYLTQLPIAWTRIFQMGRGINVDFFFRKLNKDKISDKLARRENMGQLRVNDAANKAEVREKMNIITESVQYLRQGVDSTNQDFYFASTLITITANNPEDLKFRKKEVLKYLKTKNFGVFDCTYRHEEAYKSYLPFNYLNKDLYKQSRQNMLSNGVASFFPFTSYEMNSPKGIVIGFSTENNSVVSLDTYNKEVFKNGNMLIMGTSGAGKTYLLLLMAIRLRLKHIPVYIVAPLKGHEFARVCKALGGSFVSISPSSSDCINIMEIRPIDDEASKVLDEEIGEYSYLLDKMASLQTFFKLLLPDLTYTENQILDRALVNLYKRFGITDKNETIFDKNGNVKQMPIIEDLYNELKQYEEAKRLFGVLEKFVDGSARNFNQQTNVSLDNEFTVIDISKLKGDLLTIGTFIAFEYVKAKAMEDRTKKKTVIFDELWKLIGSSSNTMAAENVLEFFKIIRGFGGNIIGGTQDIKDYYALEGGKYGEGIISNSKIKVVLNLEHKEALQVMDDLNLSETEIRKIENFKTGSGMLIANNTNIPITIKASPLENDLIATDSDTLTRVMQKSKKEAEEKTDESTI